MHWLVAVVGLVFLASVVTLCILVWYHDALPLEKRIGRQGTYFLMAEIPTAIVMVISWMATSFGVFGPFFDESDPSVTFWVELIGFILVLVYGGFALLVALGFIHITRNISRNRHVSQST